VSANSAIEWTDATWNPVRGCTKISPGCKHCYAETFAERFRGVKGHPYEQGFDLRLVPAKLAEPLRWRTSKMIFVNSMSDLFHDAVPDNYIVAVAQVMVAAKWHTYQILTKRSERLCQLLNTKLRFAAEHRHIWWGVSVEDKKYGLPRIEDLRNANAEVRFLSVEPLLEDIGKLDLRGIDWVIVGGESGAGARPMKKEWVLPLRDQCKRSGIPFFFKQWGGVRRRKLADDSKAERTTSFQPGFVTPSCPRKTAPLLQVKSRQATTRESSFLCLPSCQRVGGHWRLEWLRRRRLPYLLLNHQFQTQKSFE
jgi:protein gp37